MAPRTSRSARPGLRIEHARRRERFGYPAGGHSVALRAAQPELASKIANFLAEAIAAK